ncbi:MAG: 2-amino-4-hydroxy-6-hydroxymethyldihydropteridine diphosphokinase [Bryobacteraceae bacterium]|nr:2-amino-4-hydroxy-6-hydroxymethyldihydropteridine diphosphokinase [Bryobacteraceae bacterium]
MVVRKKVYLSLGSNMGDREANLRKALRALHSDDFRIERVSSTWETAPMYLSDQPDFLNIVAEADTTIFPMRALLRAAKIERDMGRRRMTPNGPRVIDIDLLLFGRFVMDTPQLKLPHPRMAERRFVLEPLAELVPDLRHPVTGKSVREMLVAVSDQLVRVLPGRLPAPADARQM